MQVPMENEVTSAYWKKFSEVFSHFRTIPLTMKGLLPHPMAVTSREYSSVLVHFPNLNVK